MNRYFLSPMIRPTRFTPNPHADIFTPNEPGQDIQNSEMVINNYGDTIMGNYGDTLSYAVFDGHR